MLPPHRPFRNPPKPEVILKKKQAQRAAEALEIVIKGERRALQSELRVIGAGADEVRG